MLIASQKMFNASKSSREVMVPRPLNATQQKTIASLNLFLERELQVTPTMYEWKQELSLQS